MKSLLVTLLLAAGCAHRAPVAHVAHALAQTPRPCRPYHALMVINGKVTMLANENCEGKQ